MFLLEPQQDIGSVGKIMLGIGRNGMVWIGMVGSLFLVSVGTELVGLEWCEVCSLLMPGIGRK